MHLENQLLTPTGANHFIVTSNFGTGKTFLLKREAIEMAREMPTTAPLEVANDFKTSQADSPKEDFILTKEQLWLKESKAKRVIMASDFGTGKTTLLKSVIKELATSEVTTLTPKRIFICIFLEESSMVVQSFKAFASSFTQVEVCCMSQSGMIRLKQSKSTINEILKNLKDKITVGRCFKKNHII